VAPTEEVADWHSVWCEQAAELLGEGLVAPTDEFDAEIQTSFFCHGWIPIAISGRGRDFLCLDMEPTSKGSVGQVIIIATDDWGANLVGAASFGALLENYLVDPKYGPR
jgi:cell wall assembly regulator SMI1